MRPAARALAVVPSPALATEPNNESATYEFHLEGPNTAMASNGETITLTGSGRFGVHPKRLFAGGGTFTHVVPGGGTFTGSWTGTEIKSFVPFGCGFMGFPNLCGGQLVLAVVFTPTGTSLSIPGMVWITCLIGDTPGNGAQEGIRVSVPGIVNTNKEAGGENVFIKE